MHPVYAHISIVRYVNLSVNCVICSQRYVSCGLYVNLHTHTHIYIRS